LSSKSKKEKLKKTETWREKEKSFVWSTKILPLRKVNKVLLDTRILIVVKKKTKQKQGETFSFTVQSFWVRVNKIQKYQLEAPPCPLQICFTFFIFAMELAPFEILFF
jgi:hypothetical protein